MFLEFSDALSELTARNVDDFLPRVEHLQRHLVHRERASFI